jgi:hypothetical protein
MPRTKTITVGATPDDLVQLNEVISRNPLASRHAVVRAAFRAGLSQMHRSQEYALDRLHQEAEARNETRRAVR